MKNQILLTAICVANIVTTFAQITNTFPLNDSVGIGTTSPTELLQVNGNIKIATTLTAGIIAGGSTVFGAASLINNVSGIYNYAFGDLVLKYNTSGSYNCGYGFYSLGGNTSGNYNSAYGMYSLAENIGGSWNTSQGYSAHFGNFIGSYNVAIGANSLHDSFKGSNNVAVGYSAMYYNKKGNNNTALGYQAMNTNLNGSNNTIVGYDADVTSGNLSNASAIGSEAMVDANNKVRIGNASVTSNGGQVSWTAYSDARIKTKVKDNVPGLEFINLLKPITYHFDVDKQNALMGLQSYEPVEGKYDIEKIQFTGFIAQEVEAAARQINYDFSGIDKSGEILGLRYAEFVVPLVKAVQQLSAANEELKMQNEQLQNQISESKIIENDFEKRIAKIEKKQAKNNTNNPTETIVQQIKLSADNTVASLSQNIPNPFNGKTEIHYFVPENAGMAIMKIANANGSSLFTADIKIGAGILEIDATQLSAGTYSYTLIVDGKVIDTKLMVIQR